MKSIFKSMSFWGEVVTVASLAFSIGTTDVIKGNLRDVVGEDHLSYRIFSPWLDLGKAWATGGTFGGLGIAVTGTLRRKDIYTPKKWPGKNKPHSSSKNYTKALEQMSALVKDDPNFSERTEQAMDRTEEREQPTESKDFLI